VRVDLAALLVPYLNQFSYGERLRLAAHLLDDAKAGRADRLELILRARTIIKLVDKQLLDLSRSLL
jgi:hypothetical protein